MDYAVSVALLEIWKTVVAYGNKYGILEPYVRRPESSGGPANLALEPGLAGAEKLLLGCCP